MSQATEGTTAAGIERPQTEAIAPSALPSELPRGVLLENLEPLYVDLLEPPKAREQLGVITIRMPKRLHDALRARAELEKVSLNWLCIALMCDYPIHPMPPGYGYCPRSFPVVEKPRSI